MPSWWAPWLSRWIGTTRILAAAEAYPNEEALLEAQARFRDGDSLLPGWYRQGTPLGPGVWLIDLDLFVELVIEPNALATWPERELTLLIAEEPLTFDLPEGASSDEVWLLPEVGLSEDDDEGPRRSQRAMRGPLHRALWPCCARPVDAGAHGSGP